MSVLNSSKKAFSERVLVAVSFHLLAYNRRVCGAPTVTMLTLGFPSVHSFPRISRVTPALWRSIRSHLKSLPPTSQENAGNQETKVWFPELGWWTWGNWEPSSSPTLGLVKICLLLVWASSHRGVAVSGTLWWTNGRHHSPPPSDRKCWYLLCQSRLCCSQTS